MFRRFRSSAPYGVVDERTKAISYQGDAYACRFLMFAILLDVVLRGLIDFKSNFDLLILVILAGGISTFYQIKHKIIFNDSNHKQAFLFFIITTVIAAIVAFFTALFLS